MSDEVISIEEVIAYSLGTFPGLVEDWNWGERSLFYNPDHQLPVGRPGGLLGMPRRPVR